MTIKLADLTLDPPVFLAPLAGITDLPFRTMVKNFGAGLVVSEMIASQELVQARPSARAKAELGLSVEGTAVQIAGREAYWMAECARMVAANGAKIIDINMGCPAKKVTSGYSGSALLKDLDHALTLIEAVVAAVDVPVTLKTRLGWDDDLMNAGDLAIRAEQAGIAMLTLHGRTRCQFYKGQADWRAIGRVRARVNIPVIANGDICDIPSAREALDQSGAAGVMIGRGAQGAPWKLAKIAAEIYGTPMPMIPEGDGLADLILAHYQSILGFYGRDLGLKNARKHLGWYMDGLTINKTERSAVLTATDPKVVHQLIRRYCQQPAIGYAA